MGERIESISISAYQPPFGKDLPGFQYVDYIPYKSINTRDGLRRKLFIHVLSGADDDKAVYSRDSCEGRLTPLRELQMMRWMNVVTDKENWDVKILDEAIVAKWKAETLTSEGCGFTEAMFEWCIAELRSKAPIYRDSGFVTVYQADVVKSDIAIPRALNQALSAAVEELERLKKDWHPGSDEKVLDLVHPSLFPLVYGRTRILPGSFVSLDDCIQRSGEGMKSRQPYPTLGIPQAWSHNFQWLPCNVDIKDGAKITSYINNLHPEKYKPLYAIIEQIIDKTIPLWNATLSPLKGQLQQVRIPYTEVKYSDIPEDHKPTRLPDEEREAFEERRWVWERANLHNYLVQPEPIGKFKPPHDSNEEMLVDLRRDYGQSGLQIIVKLANIHLTPENPRYEGGSWHIEGQLNERICASAIYYHSVENITESYLSFQHFLSDEVDVDYEQNHDEWLEIIFGCQQDGPTLQKIGNVLTNKQGRLLTFPNTLQHLVEPFQLADQSRPGHRKILALFLVDPNIQILSTAHIPCQQREWWAESVRQRTTLGRPNNNYLGKLPTEIWDSIVDMVEEFPLSLEEAKALRQKLMNERTMFTRMHEETIAPFSLCEH